MDEPITLWEIALHFGLLSLMAVGGGVVLLAPELHLYVVDIHKLMTSEQFAAAYSIAQVSPGPNLLYVSLLGAQIAGWPGAILITLAVILPTSVVTLLFVKASARHGDSALGRAMRHGLVPLSVGLLFAGAWVLGVASSLNGRGLAVVAVTILLMLRTKLNPIVLISAGAIAGMLGLT